MKKSLLLLSMLSVLSGCGGSSTPASSSPSTNNVQLSGAVVDWYIQDALVFADLNDDGIHQPNEPSTFTDASGKYALDTTQISNNQSYYLISKGGIDSATTEYFAATLMAESTYANITPLTTLDTLLIKLNPQITAAAADRMVKEIAGADDPLDPDDQFEVDQDPATNKHLIMGARSLAMYNNAFTDLLALIVKPTANATVADVKIKISKSAWEQLARQVAEEYLANIDNLRQNGVPLPFTQITATTLQGTMQKLLTEYNITDPTVTAIFTSQQIAAAIVTIVNAAAADFAVNSLSHNFGENEEEDRTYMGGVQVTQNTNLSAQITSWVSNFNLADIPVVKVDGDDDKDEYHH